MNQQEQEFINECGRSYPDVLAAVAYFRNMIQERCTIAANRRLGELTGVLGLTQKEELVLKSYEDKGSPASAKGRVEVGCQALSQDNPNFYFFVEWDRSVETGARRVSLNAQIRLKDREKANSLVSTLDNLIEQPAFSDEPWEYAPDSPSLMFWLYLEQNELSLLDERLDELLVSVISFLRQVQGIEEYFAVSKI
jgi:hypothetical protein